MDDNFFDHNIFFLSFIKNQRCFIFYWRNHLDAQWDWDGNQMLENDKNLILIEIVPFEDL